MSSGLATAAWTEISVVIASEEGLIPNKNYFKIGEVCQITGVQSHTLRFWEAEFKEIKPRRANGNQRLYRRDDIEKILKIKYLLKEEGHTIAGTKKFLAKRNRKEAIGNHHPPVAGTNMLHRIKADLQDLLNILEK